MKTGVVTVQNKDECVPRAIYEERKSGLQFRTSEPSLLVSWFKRTDFNEHVVNIPRKLGYVENVENVMDGKLLKREGVALRVNLPLDNSDLDQPVSSVGGAPLDVVKRYIENQKE
jgi:hypothetical protein